jgi:hypothetical protein
MTTVIFERATACESLAGLGDPIGRLTAAAA